MSIRTGVAASPLLVVALASVSSATERPTIDHVLTISGGISLGAYEAGYNWAFVRYIKDNRIESAEPHNLLAVTGASAGNVNAFLTAISWCADDTFADTVDDNLFRKVWTNISWERLMPAEGLSCKDYTKRYFDGFDQLQSTAQEALTSIACADGQVPYRSDDGIVTRNAFYNLERLVAEALQKKQFRPSCELPLGITITRLNPATLSIKELKVKSQRFAATFRARSSGMNESSGTLAFIADGLRDESIGNYLTLVAEDESGTIPVALPPVRPPPGTSSLFDLIEASAAFPAAFGHKRLSYCEDASTSVYEGAKYTCVPGPTSRVVSATFFDGGLFDNVPLGVARSLVTQRSSRVAVSQPGADVQSKAPPSDLELEYAPLVQDRRQPTSVTFHYIDPDKRRYSQGEIDPGEPARVPEPEAHQPHGARYLVRLVSNFVGVARQYELQSEARFAWPDKRIPVVLSRRFSPIFGENLGNFGAFLAVAFREYDYHAGVYDAAHDLARAKCERRGTPTRKCLVDELLAIEQSLRLEKSPDTDYVFRKLMLEEFSKTSCGLSPPIPVDEASSDLEAIMSHLPVLAEGSPVPMLLEVMLDQRCKMLMDKPLGFPDLIGRLAEKKVRFSDPSEQGILDDFDAWASDAALRIVRRLHTIEEADEAAGQNQPYALSLFSVVEVGVLAQESTHYAGWRWFGPSTARSAWFQVFAPYAISTFPGRGGLDVRLWQPTWGCSSWFALGVPITPFSWWRQSHAGAAIGATALFRLPMTWLNAVELGVRGQYDYWRPKTLLSWHEESRWEAGAEGVIHVGTKLRAGVLVRPGRGDEAREVQTEFLLGLEDVGGLLDWAFLR